MRALICLLGVFFVYRAKKDIRVVWDWDILTLDSLNLA